MPLKAIQTHYRGRRFRSRTEARWAVFFDELKLRWAYEDEGYVLPETGCYLPDFKLTLPDDETIYCEVNHDDADDFDDRELAKLREFANESRCKVLLLTGSPDQRAYNQLVPNSRPNSLTLAFFRDCEPYVVTADGYWAQALQFDCSNGRSRFDFDERTLRNSFGRGYVNALYAARAARFEYGESPA
jgi:hypothetical protein